MKVSIKFLSNVLKQFQVIPNKRFTMEADAEFEIFHRFPYLAAMDEGYRKWSGFISTEDGKTVRLSLEVPHFPEAEDVRLVREDMDQNAIQFWDRFFINAVDGNYSTLLGFLDALKTAVTNLSEGQGGDSASTRNSNGCLQSLIDEIYSVGVERVEALKSDFSEIIIKQQDRSGREHQLKLKIPVNYPDEKPLIHAELPFSDGFLKWPQRIPEINQMFLAYVNKCCKFWDDMDELDATVRVVDPLQPSRSHFHRRILLEDNVIMHLIFDAIAPRAIPHVSFAGPERNVEAFTRAMDQVCAKSLWNESSKVLQNLESLLHCQYVLKAFDGMDEGEGEDQTPCTICYVFLFEDEVPEIGCQCGCSFHNQCLQDLYVTDVAANGLKRSVECPNCQMDICVPRGFAKKADW